MFNKNISKPACIRSDRDETTCFSVITYIYHNKSKGNVNKCNQAKVIFCFYTHGEHERVSSIFYIYVYFSKKRMKYVFDSKTSFYSPIYILTLKYIECTWFYGNFIHKFNVCRIGQCLFIYTIVWKRREDKNYVLWSLISTFLIRKRHVVVDGGVQFSPFLRFLSLIE